MKKAKTILSLDGIHPRAATDDENSIVYSLNAPLVGGMGSSGTVGETRGIQIGDDELTRISTQLHEPLILQLRVDHDNICFPRASFWFTRIISIIFHIFLIAIFETIFFFEFVTHIEDSGIQNTFQQFVAPIQGACVDWNSNFTQDVNYILGMFINATLVQQEATGASLIRESHNHSLFVKSWIYIIVLFAIVGAIAIFAFIKKFSIDWTKIIIENIYLIIILGLYEYFFFQTIILNFHSISIPEIEEFIITLLHSSCGLFTKFL